MKWIVKAMVQQVLGFIPAGGKVNYFLQRRVTGNLPVDAETFKAKVGEALTHLSALRRQRPETAFSELTFFEFGTGWDLILPLVYWMAGVERQTLIDLSPHLRPELIRDSIRRLPSYAAELERSLGSTVRVPSEAPRSTADVSRLYGISYHAPADARNTSFGEGSFDVITSTDTMEHIPARDLRPILEECRRLLGEDGIFSAIIDTQDHYSYFDTSISRYNYLQYPDLLWRLLNPRLQYQNRLRVSDYETMAADSGFIVVSAVRDAAAAGEIEEIRRLRLHRRYRDMPVEDVAAKHCHLLLRKSSSGIFPPGGKRGEPSDHPQE